jgi:hypothetical protein
VWEHKLDHLNVEEARDFRYRFGSVWDLVKTMLGHCDVRTTIDVTGRGACSWPGYGMRAGRPPGTL